MGQRHFTKGRTMKWDEIYFWTLGVLSVLVFIYVAVDVPADVLRGTP